MAPGLFKIFYTIALPVVALASVFILFGISASSGRSTFLDLPYLGYLLRSIDPYFFAALGVAFAIGLSVLGAAWCACWENPIERLPALRPPALLTQPAALLQGHLYHRLQSGGRSSQGAAHYVQEPD